MSTPARRGPDGSTTAGFLSATVLGAVGLVLILRALDWLIHNMIWVSLIVVILGALVVGTYNHRKRLELLDLEAGMSGRWRRVHRFQTWPKFCAECGTTVHTWRALALHETPERSVCAAYRGAPNVRLRESFPSPPPEPVDYADTPAAGAVDTLTDEPAALEEDEVPQLEGTY